ncbi:saccharopine dehydrogenase [Fusarium acutatum]|uniref:Saccharopine dehydrogenase [NAD(+), L-lysine-forming] n=1 Tax=Fusarium acutatum TaxID=78861 RepID=A0A8H4JKI2_9HYPO|nr:saccharopine dehydrogenase [Fusarium acutatum]
MSPVVIHLRSETKPLERRSPCNDPYHALLDAGYTVRVEESPDRIYKIDEFRDVGAEIVPAGSWVNAPKDDIILGLKEIEANGTPLPHTYIHFAHVFKKQSGWASELSRFANAGGLLCDLEFLTDEDGRRVAAFGYWAGYAGTALALLSWAHQLLNPGVPQGPVPIVDSASALTELVKDKVDAARSANDGALPRLIVIGALGRCGKGAIAAAEAIGVSDIMKWDIAETSKGGPFPEVASSDIFVNCVYLGSNKIPPFTTFEALSAPGRRLRVICDVSCDPNSENSPIPVYSSYSSFEKPTVPASEHIDGPELRIIAIDHLPTMVAHISVRANRSCCAKAYELWKHISSALAANGIDTVRRELTAETLVLSINDCTVIDNHLLKAYLSQLVVRIPGQDEFEFLDVSTRRTITGFVTGAEMTLDFGNMLPRDEPIFGIYHYLIRVDGEVVFRDCTRVFPWTVRDWIRDNLDRSGQYEAVIETIDKDEILPRPNYDEYN